MSDTVTLEQRLLRLERTLEALATRERVSAAVGALASPGVVYVASDGTLKTEADFAYIEADNELRVGRARLAEQATPATPASGFGLIYPKSDGHFYGLNDGGVERLMTGIRGMGTAFPTSPAPATNDLFYRTDLQLLCVFDGVRWLTADEYIVILPWFPLITLPYTSTVPNTLLLTPTRSDYGYYITKASCYTRVATTNNGSNYWGLRLFYSATNLWDFNTSAQAADANVTHANNAINTATAATATFFALNAQSKTGAPGSLTVAAFVQYRLIVT